MEKTKRSKKIDRLTNASSVQSSLEFTEIKCLGLPEPSIFTRSSLIVRSLFLMFQILPGYTFSLYVIVNVTKSRKTGCGLSF